MNKRDKLIEDHLNYVHWVIRSFIHVNPAVCGLEYDDLYQEGCIALWRASKTFDGQQGAQFHSFAISVIRNHLVDYCRKIQRQTAPVVSLETWDAEMVRSDGLAWNGEDSLFLKEFMDKGYTVYTAPVTIAREEAGESTWFGGYHEKFFRDRGVLYRYLYGRLSGIMALRFLLAHRKKLCTEVSLAQAYGWMQSPKNFSGKQTGG